MKSPWRLYLAAGLVGVFVGLVGAAFHALLDQGTNGRAALREYLEPLAVPGWLVSIAICTLILVFTLWLVRRIAPETAGSGVQEIESILAGERSLRWQRVLPIKFVAGTLAVGSGLVLGREGPTIHMGAALGQMANERLGVRPGDDRALLAAGAAAGLATAFNAPLASIVFVTEELREHFEYRFATIQSVILACCASVIVSGWLLGQGPDMPMPEIGQVPLDAAPLFLILGLFIGILGVLFNALLLGSVSAFRALGAPQAYIATALAGVILGALLWFTPATVGGGERLVESLLHGHPALLFLVGLLAVRLLTTVGSYGLGLPGGIFAPMLALGTICGAAFAELVAGLAPTLALGLVVDPAVFAVAAMGALFAATVRAPLTGIILVIELTDAQALALPIILTCLTATFTAEGLGGRPIYSSLLGLGKQSPPLKPARRIAVGAAILGGFIAIEQFDLSWHGSDSGSIAPVVETTRLRPLSQVPQRAVQASNPSMPLKSTPPAAPIKGRATPVAESSPDRAQALIGQFSAEAARPNREPGRGSDAATTRRAETGQQQVGRGTNDRPRYSIQLISFRDQASLARFAEQQGLIGEAQTIANVSPSQRWRAVLIGLYASREDAADALQRLPTRLRKLNPIVRDLGPNTRVTPILATPTR